MYAKKSLGQHFLIHKHIAERIVNTAQITLSDIVVEIGPGTGILTKALIEKAGHVLALEVDKNLIDVLDKKFATAISRGILNIQHQDIRTFTPCIISKPYILVANIPYYLTSNILRLFLETTCRPQRIVLLVQKEVAERIARSKKESILSISVKVYGNPHYEFTVPRGAFLPAPTVDSAVLSIRDIHSTFSNEREAKYFFNIIHEGFSHKRKKLVNNLSGIVDLPTAESALSAVGVTLNIRAEDVPVEKWRELTQYFITNINTHLN